MANETRPGWLRRHKKAVIILSILLVLGLGVFFWLRSQVNAAMEALSQSSEATDTVAYRDVSAAITASGQLTSAASRSLSADLSGVKISQLLVEVGDSVTPGQVLAVLDVSDLSDSLTDAEQALNTTRAQNRLALDNARRALADAQAAQTQQAATARDGLDAAWQAYSQAGEAYDQSWQDWQQARRDWQQAADDAAEAEEKYAAVQEDYEAASAAAAQLSLEIQSLSAQLSLLDAGQDAARIVALQQQIADLNQQATTQQALALSLQYAYQTDGGAYQAADAACQAAEAQAEAQEAAVEKLAAAKDSAYSGYQSALRSYEYTLSSSASAVATAENAYTAAQLSAGTAADGAVSAVETYTERLADGTLLSAVSGTVTQVYAEEGDLYPGGVLLLVEDTQALEISAEIDEYDIADVAVGQSVVFKTDASGDAELTALVSHIAPKPSQQLALGDVTYTVTMTVTQGSDRLRLGMTARLNLIIAQVKHVLTIPYDAVQIDDQGASFVTLIEAGADGSQTRRDVPVTVGLEGDYYVQVEGLSEGQTVLIPAEDGLDLMSMMMEYSTF